jgi:hypothetical protein
MKAFTLAVIIALATIPAYAQGYHGQSFDKPGKKTEQEKAAEEKQRKEEEKAYKDSVSRVPDRAQKFDPWGNMR